MARRDLSTVEEWLSLKVGDMVRVDPGDGLTRRMRVVADPELVGDVVRLQVADGSRVPAFVVELLQG